MSGDRRAPRGRASRPTIVDRAEAGQEIELTRRGMPVAVVVSLREFERLRGERAPFGVAYKRFLKAHPLGDVGLDAGFFDTHRSKDEGRKIAL